ncbi:unnamed protein product [Soboliphyme baturini]|uniref:LCCL domain-containing protein n=1 Tax=Soboliphyme baturini TaxID=241478 RepID=A0A183I907_9BILA|nr:unnamed protein product [Soboliphyme baturini]
MEQVHSGYRLWQGASVPQQLDRPMVTRSTTEPVRRSITDIAVGFECAATNRLRPHVAKSLTLNSKTQLQGSGVWYGHEFRGGAVIPGCAGSLTVNHRSNVAFAASGSIDIWLRMNGCVTTTMHSSAEPFGGGGSIPVQLLHSSLETTVVIASKRFVKKRPYKVWLGDRCTHCVSALALVLAICLGCGLCSWSSSPSSSLHTLLLGCRTV